MDKKGKGKKLTENKDNKENKKEPIKKQSLNKSEVIKNKEPIQQPTTLSCELKIENFPTRNELMQIVNDILTNNNINSDSYKCSNASNRVSYIFKDSELAFKIVKELNIIKIKNPLYSKLKINIEFSNSNSNTSNYSAKRNKYKKKIIKSKKSNKYITPTLRSSSIFINEPYVDQSKRDYRDYLNNKVKWLNPNGFRVKGGADKFYQLGQIDNYVTSSSGKYDFNSYNFRENDKSKWIDQHGFTYKRVQPNIFDIEISDDETYKSKKNKKKEVHSLQNDFDQSKVKNSQLNSTKKSNQLNKTPDKSNENTKNKSPKETNDDQGNKMNITSVKKNNKKK